MASELIERIALLEKQKAECVAALKDVRRWIMEPFQADDETLASQTLHPAFLKALKSVSAALASAGSPHGE